MSCDLPVQVIRNGGTPCGFISNIPLDLWVSARIIIATPLSLGFSQLYANGVDEGHLIPGQKYNPFLNAYLHFT